MVRVPGSKRSVLSFAAFVLFAVAGSSCGESNQSEDQDTATATQNQVADIPPPFTIDLLPGYEIVQEVTMVGRAYYFKSDYPENPSDEAGIFFGALPDTTSPKVEYTKREYRDLFMGDSANWREFKAAGFIHREVYIDRGPEDKIHSWCYSTNPETLEKLCAMIKTIRQ